MFLKMKRYTYKVLLCVFFLISMMISVQAEENTVLIEDIQSEYAILVDTKEHHVFYEKNSNEKMYPASMTKVLTLMVAIEHIDQMDQTVTITEEMLDGLQEANASVVGFQVNETVTMKDLLYGIFLTSGADACRAVSITLAGSEAAFVQWMNDKVQELQLSNTHIVNTTGLHDNDHFTTAKDFSLILEHALNNPLCYEIITADTYTTSSTPAHPNGIVLNSTMRSKERSAGLDQTLITGGKTGSTLEAQLCLASFREQDGIRYILITSQAPFNDANDSAVYDAHSKFQYIKDHVRYETAAEQGMVLSSIDISYSWTHSLDIILDEPLYVFMEEPYDLSKIEVTYEGKTSIKAPVAINQQLGEIVIRYEGEELKRIPYTAEVKVRRSTLIYISTVLADFITHYLYIILLLAAMALMSSLYIRRNRNLFKRLKLYRNYQNYKKRKLYRKHRKK